MQHLVLIGQALPNNTSISTKSCFPQSKKIVQSLHIDKVYILLYNIHIMTQLISIKDARNNLADIVSRVEIAGDEIIITKFGKPRAMLVPVSNVKSGVGAFDEVFGLWKDRKDIKNTAQWVRNLRRKISLRQR